MTENLDPSFVPLNNLSKTERRPSPASLWLGIISVLPYLIILIMFLGKGRTGIVNPERTTETGSLILVFGLLGLLYLLMVWGVFWGVAAISKGMKDFIGILTKKPYRTPAFIGVLLGLTGIVSNIIYYLTVGKSGP